MIDVPAHEILAIVGHALLWCCLIAALPGVGACPPVCRAVATLLGLGLVCIPWSGDSLLILGRGLVNDVSPTTQVVLLFGLCATIGVHNRYTQPLRRLQGLVLALVLVPLYASTMGYVPVDLYAWGYEPHAMLLALGASMAIMWFWQPVLALGFLAGLAAFQLHLMASPNLWDYLSDPLLCGGSLVCMVIGDRRNARPCDHQNVVGTDCSSPLPAQRQAA